MKKKLQKYTMLEYMKHKAILGGILLDCPAKFMLSTFQLLHDTSSGINKIINSLRDYENNEPVVEKVSAIKKKRLEITDEGKYKSLKDKAMNALWLYGSMCQIAAEIIAVLYKFWKDSGSISMQQVLHDMKRKKQ